MSSSFNSQCITKLRKKTCRRKGTRKSYEDGQLIEGSRWTTEAAQLVWAELKIETVVFDVPAEEIYVGFIRKGVDLWQDEAKCRYCTVKDEGVDYSEDGQPALWYDALHPSSSGAEAHFRLLVKLLNTQFDWLEADDEMPWCLARQELMLRR